jgi:hypothetical protein
MIALANQNPYAIARVIVVPPWIAQKIAPPIVAGTAPASESTTTPRTQTREM